MRAIAVVRALYGVALLIAPDRMVRTVTGEPAGWSAVLVCRLLGARHLAQALTVERSGSRGWLLLGVALDSAHAFTTIAIAVLSRNHRRLAAFNTAVAGGWILNGLRGAKCE